MVKGFTNRGFNVEMGDSITSSQTGPTTTTSSSRRKILKWVLIVLVIVLFILAAVFIGLYIYEKHGRRPPPPQKQYCKSEGCIQVSANMLRDMNQSADPCEDFYEYACGRWMKNNPIPDSRTSWGQFQILMKDNVDVLKKLIVDPQIRTKYSKNNAVVKSFTYYDSCMNEKVIEALDAKPLHKLIKDYGSWNITDKNFTSSSWKFMETFVGMHKLALAPLFNMYVGTDLQDSTKNMIEFHQNGLGIARDAYLYNSSNYIKTSGAYKVFMTDLMKLLGAGDDVGARVEEVYNFEKQLAQVAIPKEFFYRPETIYKKMTLRKLNQEVGVTALLNFTDFLERMFVQTGYKITGDEEIGIYGLQYFKNVSQIINKADKRIMANYMMWNVVRTYAKQLSKKFVAVFTKYTETLYGVSTATPRWQSCVANVQSALGMAVGLLFVDKTFSGESKTAAKEMISNIQSAFIDNMKNVDWMDPETKMAAEGKAKAIRENIGYPNYITDPVALAKEYKGLDVDKSKFFENNINEAKYKNMKNYEEIKTPVDKTRWVMAPPVVNAYYSPTENKIVFPAGILRSPFFDLTFPKWINYGAIGLIVGHEISHGFDDTGRKFNKDGNILKWWSNSSIANFKKKTECFVEQYSNYTFHGFRVNGQQTLGENIADNGGMKATYKAYQQWKEKHGEELMLPGLEDFSQEKLFFLGFAQVWCDAYRRSAAYNAVTNGVHSPNSLRVIGTVSNSYEFAKAYNCPVGSKMNPKKKCFVW